MQRSLCNICRLIYVPVEENAIKPLHDHCNCSACHTSQPEQLPDDWICSVCYTTREDFQQLTKAPDVSLESKLCPFQY